MVTKNNLEKLRQANINDVAVSELKDISEVIIDKDTPVIERINSFVEQIGNPYLFKVGCTPVKICFTSFAPTLEQSLEMLFTKTI